MPLQEITRDELSGMIAQLQEALAIHQQWHGSPIRTLACRLPPDPYDSGPDAHKTCRFGQWYFNRAPEKLRDHSGFAAIGEEHKAIHQLANPLLLAAGGNGALSPLDYDNFASALERLRQKIGALQQELEASLAGRDSLTGAMTRRDILPVLRDHQELIRRHRQPCCITMMGLRGLRADPLADPVRYVTRHLRPYDKVFRYEEMEFLLCMPYSGLTQTHGVIRRLHEGLGALTTGSGESPPLPVSAAFGLTLLDPGVAVETSIDRAVAARRAAEAPGSNPIRIWDPSM